MPDQSEEVVLLSVIKKTKVKNSNFTFLVWTPLL